ncbi:TPA: hypothetical protein HA235_07760 [Candidatus Woesearchaeota archaeon]|nr:hypothetical protein [Candidatus Woesearchaeota archaeon]HIH32575.1 hypothetical protein [Candidatus Woesearchaeota archaeon]HIH54810.1 hypothetical protein [Candidatus Woesearchaeota archaeon]HIJ02146.1 hypothetical protein [Candidatus Woesearchaeota archaeon]HIJ13648.1 hypothetical protein [Candidatus Woesearchaeota archaeon]
MYSLSIKLEADKMLRKLQSKNKKQLKIIEKKINEIRENPNHEYKFLRNPLQNLNRVHINKHFVLIFKIDHQNQNIDIYFYGHHDEVYKWRPN